MKYQSIDETSIIWYKTLETPATLSDMGIEQFAPELILTLEKNCFAAWHIKSQDAMSPIKCWGLDQKNQAIEESVAMANKMIDLKRANEPKAKRKGA